MPVKFCQSRRDVPPVQPFSRKLPWIYVIEGPWAAVFLLGMYPKGPFRVVRNDYCRGKCQPLTWSQGQRTVPTDMVRIKSSQKVFTEDEVVSLTGICLEHVRGLARNRHLGKLVRAAEAAGSQAEKWLFTNSDLMILAMLHPRCEH